MQFKLEDGSVVEEIPKNYTGHVKHIAGNQFWLKNGKPHRLDAPASVYTNGSSFWYFNGKRHCTVDQAKEDDFGGSHWLLNRTIYSFSTIFILIGR